jgi:hypothetical protein
MLVGPQVGLTVDRPHPGPIDEERTVVDGVVRGELGEAAHDDQIKLQSERCNGAQRRPVRGFGETSGLLG